MPTHNFKDLIFLIFATANDQVSERGRERRLNKVYIPSSFFYLPIFKTKEETQKVVTRDARNDKLFLPSQC